MEPVYGLARGMFFPPLHFGLRWTIEGAHRIPVRGPVLVASNHVSYLDPLVVAYLADRRHRRVRFLAKAELFDKRGFGQLLRQINQIPVQRDSSAAAGSLEFAIGALERGECVAVFPEGTISLDLEPMVGKSGTARLAAATGVPVTPVGLWGTHRILFKGRKPAWRLGVAETVVVGDPIRIGPDEDVHEATDRVMAGIVRAVRRARELYPQRPGPGDDDWWARPPDSAQLRSSLAGTRS
ncbi:MAG TPA: lysophospholipid acyltransferase family protein [Acidimicrobiia bacterium]